MVMVLSTTAVIYHHAMNKTGVGTEMKTKSNRKHNFQYSQLYLALANNLH